MRIFMVNGTYVRVSNLSIPQLEAEVKLCLAQGNPFLRVKDTQDRTWSLMVEKISHIQEDLG